MKRKGVSDGKCSPWCAIKERLDKLWNRTIGSIVKINDITPDGEGKFTIAAGSNIRITEAGAGNGIMLDTTGGVTYYTSDDPKIVIDNSDLKISLDNVAKDSDLDTVADAVNDILDGTVQVSRAVSADNATSAGTANNALALGGVAPSGYQSKLTTQYESFTVSGFTFLKRTYGNLCVISVINQTLPTAGDYTLLSDMSIYTNCVSPIICLGNPQDGGTAPTIVGSIFKSGSNLILRVKNGNGGSTYCGCELTLIS